MRHPAPISIVLLALLLAACEVNSGDVDALPPVEDEDVEESEDVADEPEDTATPAPEEDTATPPKVPDHEPVTGCEWTKGDWDMLDCQGDSILIAFHPQSDCSVQVVSNSPVFAGALGKVANAGLSLYLPATGASCHGFYDGDILYGACDVTGGPCGFVAVKQD